MGPTKLFRNIETDKRFLAVEESNGDIIFADFDENDKPINVTNRVPKKEVNELLDNTVIEKDENTVGFTFDGGKFVERKRPERL